MKKIIQKFKIIALVLLVASFSSCEDDEGTLPKVLANFTFTVNQDTGAVTFINTSENTSNYQWDFGDNTSSTEINPIHVYSESGVYTVKLVSKNVAGASDEKSDEVTIAIPVEPEAIALPVNFDGANVNYEPTVFNGATFEIVDNPSASGSNTSNSKVGAITNSGAAFEGLFFDIPSQINLETHKTVKLNFWSEVATDVLMKLEEGTGANIEVVASHTGSGWEALEFTFDSADAYSRLTLFVDGPGTTAGTFYIDDITLGDATVPEGPTASAPTPPARDAQNVISLFSDAYDDITVSEWSTAWDNADIEDFSPVDGDTVKKVSFGDEGGFLGVDFSANAFDATAFTHFHMDYWVVDDITAGQVLNPKWSNHANGVEVNAFEYTNAVSESGQWVSVDIPVSDFGGDTTRNNIAQFILATGNTLDVVFIDNIYFYKEASTTPDCTETMLQLPIDFDCSGIDYASKEKGNVSFTVVDNPEMSGINNEETKVGRITNVGATWENVFFNLDTAVDFSTNKTIKFKLFSNQALPILLKFEDGTEGPAEVSVDHTGSGWEELTFDFTSSASYNDMVIFVDGPGTASGTFYIDDIIQVATETTAPVAFDDGLLNNGDFENGSESWLIGVDDDSQAPVATENGNTFYSVDVTAAGNSFDVNVSQKLNIMQGSTYKLTFDAWSNVNRGVIAGIGLSGGDFSNNSETVNITTSRETYTLTLEATNFGASDARVLFDLGAEVGQVSIDNVSLFLMEDNGSGTGGGSTSGGGCTGEVTSISSFPADFEGCESFISTFTDSGSITTSLAANPLQTGNTSANALKIVKANGTNRWAGLQNKFDSNFDATSTFKMKVYSSKANVVFRFEINSAPQDAGSGNPGPVFVTIPNANTWTEIEVTFTGIPPSNTGVNQFIIKPDNPDGTDGEVTTSEETYYIDDITAN